MAINSQILHLIDQIREDKTHGASELARQAVGIFRILASTSRSEDTLQLWSEIQETAAILKSTRPSMAPLANAVNRLLKGISADHHPDAASLRRALEIRADELISASRQATVLIAGYTAGLAADNETIMTHSYSSTVSAAIKSAYEKHRVKAIVTRSGAGRTGIRSARELNEAGIEVIFIDDTAIGPYISMADKVLVGADRVCSDGSLVNGVGTYLLALAAKKAHVPFFVLCETLKFDPVISGYQAELEEKEPDEVISPGTLKGDIVVKNPYFDITPLNLITGFITETGLIEAKGLAALMRELR